jgi:hypothetical protein
MTQRKNEDYITCISNTTGWWKIGIKSSSTYITDTVEEVGGAIEKLFAALQPLCRVTSCDFTVWVYDEDVSLCDALNLNVEENDVYHETIECETAIDTSTLRAKFRSVSNDHDYIRITNFKIREMDIRLRLGSDDIHVAKSDTKFYKRQVHDEIIDEEPSTYPLEITLDYRQSENEKSEMENTMELKFRSQSEIWFAETDAGQINRERLVSVFQEILEQFDVMWTSFDSEITSKQTLREKGMTDIIFE